jgi:hypothetical protein
MQPYELDLPIFRDKTFQLELVSQYKNYSYDPDTDVEPADLQRTHQENLEYHGYVYEYIDFASTYDSAELVVMKAYVGNGDNPPVMTLVDAAADLTGILLTDKSVIITISAVDAKKFPVDDAKYKLRLLIDATNTVDILVHGKITVSGEK